MISLFDFGNPFSAIYANSSESIENKNSWRKPSPQMIFEAKKDLPIDLNKSILIGDRKSDLIAGLNAKIPHLFHVKTGHGYKEREKILLDKILSNNVQSRESNSSRTYIKLINNLEEFPFNILD